MASGKVQNSWPIWILVVVALVFVVMALSKEKPKGPDAPSHDLLVDASEATGSQKAAAIKPSHDSSAVSDVDTTVHKAGIVVPPTQVMPKNAFAVQVYSFKDKARADAALVTLIEKGYTAYIVVSDLGARGIWYRVRVGTFENEKDAQTALGAITNDFKSGIIVSE